MKTIAIIYHGRKHLERLTLALRKQLPEGYEVAGFVSASEFLSWDGHGRVKALLLSEESGTPEEKEKLTAMISARKIPLWNLSEDADLAEEPGQMFLYQPIDRMAERLRESLGGNPSGAKAAEPQKTECTCVGVIALGAENSTACAMRIAREHAVRNKTVLLCVNPWPEESKDWKPGESDMSELLYLLKEYGSSWYQHEKFCLRSAGNVKVISGYSCFTDYGQFAEEDAEALFAGLEAAGYDCLVVDFGASPQPSLAVNCEKLYVLGTGIGGRYAVLERMLREEGIAERLHPAS